MNRKATILTLSMLTLLTSVTLLPAARADCPDLHGGPQTIAGCTAYEGTLSSYALAYSGQVSGSATTYEAQAGSYAVQVGSWATGPNLQAAAVAWLGQWNDSLGENGELVTDYAHESAVDPSIAAVTYATVYMPGYAVSVRTWANAFETQNENNFRSYAAGRVAAVDPFLHDAIDRARQDGLTIVFYPVCFLLTGTCGELQILPLGTLPPVPIDPDTYPAYDLGTPPPVIPPGVPPLPNSAPLPGLPGEPQTGSTPDVPPSYPPAPTNVPTPNVPTPNPPLPL